MKPARFEHYAPATLEEALGLTAQHGDEQKVLAGGQSLLAMMNLRLARPERLVDLNRVAGLAGVEAEDDGLAIGALARQSAVLADPLVAERAPLLRAALRFVGHQHTRNRGTAVGSIVHADPSAEIPTVWLAMGGRITLERASGRREVSAEDFFVTHYTTAIADDEIATRVVFDPPPPNARWAFEEAAKRHGDFALLTVAVQLGVEGERVRSASIAVGAGADRPLRAPRAEALLVEGAPADEAAAAVAQDIRPLDDIHATARYRRTLARVLSRRAIERALSAE
jgi:aerobic carbon-monoxide dehydrogenase medium subunit